MKNKHLIGLLAFICVALAVSGGIAIWIGGDDTQVTATPPLSQELVETVQPDVGASNPSDFLYIAIVILSISTLIAVGISFYLYKWRRILLANPNSVVPEERSEERRVGKECRAEWRRTENSKK